MPDTNMDLEQFRQEAREWIAVNLPRRSAGRLPRVARTETMTPEQIDRAKTLQRKLFDGGFAGISFPTEYGGRGLTGEHERVFREEAAEYVLPDFGGAGFVTIGPIARSLLAHGSPEMRARYIPKILSGEEIWCQFYSEPEAGSDLAGIRTRATRDGDHWVLTGSKIWSTGAYYADFAMCLARTDWDVPKHRGVTWFVVPTDAPGLTIRQIPQIDGAAGFCEEFLDGVVVDADAVIGEVNQGWTVTQTMLVYERGAGEGGAAAVVEPRDLAPDLVALARETGRAGDPIARQLLARAHINDFAQFHLGRRIAARLRRADRPDPAVAAYGKLASGTFAPIRGRIGVEIGGADALLWSGGDEAASRYAVNYLNGRMTSIAAGTNEMQRNGIGERVLGLPREPSFDTKKPFSEVLRDARSGDWAGGRK
jgi:alkylation response protein AidB-like acyl-CoA dehydrogenase